MKDSPNILVGQRITAARERANLTKADLARAVNASRSMVTQWESGQRRPNADNVVALGNALGVEPGWILAGEGEQGPTGSGRIQRYLRNQALGSVGLREVVIPSAQDHSLDTAVLGLAIETLEIFLAHHRRKLDPKAKAQAVVSLYTAMRLWRPEALTAANVTPLVQALLAG